MSVNNISKARVHVGNLIVGNPTSDFGPLFVEPGIAITGITIAQGPVVSASGTWTAGQVVAITGLQGTTLRGLADGIYVVAVGGSGSFTLPTNVTTSGSYTASTGMLAITTITGTAITSISGQTWTANGHGLLAGQLATLTGVTGITTTNGPVNGTYLVTASSTNTFVLSQYPTGAPSTFAGTVTAGTVATATNIPSPATIRGIYNSGPIASGAIAPATTASVTKTYNITGVQPGDLIDAIPPVTMGTNLTYSAYCATAGVITLVVSCGTTSSGNATGNWSFIWTKFVI